MNILRALWLAERHAGNARLTRVSPKASGLQSGQIRHKPAKSVVELFQH